MAQRVLIVDDDSSILDLLRVLLESEGYEVEAFDFAPTALESAENNPPDVAIIDLMMPEMNGLDLLKALRANSATQDVPVLICSAYYENMLKSEQELRELNVSRLRKPFHVDELLRIVGELASRRAAPQPLGKRAAGGGGRVNMFAADVA